MRFNSVDSDICETQSRIYEYVANQGYDLELFSNLYLHSDFCRRAFDTIYSRFQVADELECLDFIMPEIGAELKKYDDNKMFDPAVAAWIGFVYRQLYIETEIMSSELVDLVTFQTMIKYYPGLHTIDENMATDIICENFGINKKKEM